MSDQDQASPSARGDHPASRQLDEMSQGARVFWHRVMDSHWNRDGKYDFMLTDEPLTKAQVRTLFECAIWARFSGFQHDDNEAAAACADALEAARPGMFR